MKYRRMTVKGILRSCENVILWYNETDYLPDDIEQIIGEKTFDETKEFCKAKGWKLIYDTDTTKKES